MNGARDDDHNKSQNLRERKHVLHTCRPRYFAVVDIRQKAWKEFAVIHLLSSYPVISKITIND